jgi:hypothetical protein
MFEMEIRADKSYHIGWVVWYMSVIPATQEAEAGGSGLILLEVGLVKALDPILKTQ